MKITCCPSLLLDGYSVYSPRALNKLFNGRKVSPILQYDSPEVSEEVKEEFIENRTSISISGVQTKVGIIQDGNVLRLSKKGEQSTHILKPTVKELLNGQYTCANEHLTMQIASQVYGIEVAANGLCFFKSGECAYITKRFDIVNTDTKLKVEDFASIAGKTTHEDSDAKYQSSYEELGELIRKAMPAWRVEIEKYFLCVLFNYVFSNGDAHLKNFSAIQTNANDYKLSPAYDLLNTSLHIKDNTFALKKGLFKDRNLSFVSHKDFLDFAEKIGCDIKRSKKALENFLSQESENKTKALIKVSYLSDALKQKYSDTFCERLEYLRIHT